MNQIYLEITTFLLNPALSILIWEGIYTRANEIQSLKALYPILFTLRGISTCKSDLQLSKVLGSMLAKQVGITIFLNEIQELKAY